VLCLILRASPGSPPKILFLGGTASLKRYLCRGCLAIRQGRILRHGRRQGTGRKQRGARRVLSAPRVCRTCHLWLMDLRTTWRCDNSAVLPRAGRPVNHKILKLLSAAETRNAKAAVIGATRTTTHVRFVLPKTIKRWTFRKGLTRFGSVIRS
jgi:hypothetical protein